MEADRLARTVGRKTAATRHYRRSSHHGADLVACSVGRRQRDDRLPRLPVAIRRTARLIRSATARVVAKAFHFRTVATSPYT